jgi:hypothetical protein
MPPPILPPSSKAPDRRLINGLPSTLPRLHQSLADAAEAYIYQQQRAPCSSETKLLFARFDWHGVGNDVNLAVRALATAVIQQRQLVFLPPSVKDRAANPWLLKLKLSAEHPWHWLAGAGLPLTSLLVDSACQQSMMQESAGLMQFLADNETDPSLALHRMGNTALAQRSRAWKPIWRVGLHTGVIPLPFRSQGLLWWFQVLTSYLVRARAPLDAHLRKHPAMRPFLQASADTPGVVGAFGRASCHKRWCDHIGPGWFPPVWFDVALHLRLGDVCGQNAAIRGQKARKCTSQPSQEALELMRDHGLRGRLFVASDSHDAVQTISTLGPSYGFEVSSLSFDRGHFGGAAALSSSNHSVGTEKAPRSKARDLAVLVGSLMDVLLLSRSSVLVGSMMSNFPRMALQLRVQMPVDGEHRYLPLDGRTWCTRTSCRMNYSCAQLGRNRASRASLEDRGDVRIANAGLAGTSSAPCERRVRHCLAKGIGSQTPYRMR